MPAVTMVAAWMSAETGVGPSMASGSQVKSGPCALLPNAPSMRQKGIAIASQPPAPLGASWMAANSGPNSTVP